MNIARRPGGASAFPVFSDQHLARLGAGDAIVLDGVLGPAVAATIAVEVAEVAGEGLAPAHMGRGAARHFDLAERGDEITWIDPAGAPPGIAHLTAWLGEVRALLNRDAYLGLRRFDLQLAQYRSPGARYARHADAFRAQARRRLTVIYYVNPGWTPEAGGVIRLFTPEGPLDVEPLLDRAVIFRSELLEHEVLPSWRTRTALTAWFYGADGVL